MSQMLLGVKDLSFNGNCRRYFTRNLHCHTINNTNISNRALGTLGRDQLIKSLGPELKRHFYIYFVCFNVSNCTSAVQSSALKMSQEEMKAPDSQSKAPLHLLHDNEAKKRGVNTKNT